MKKATILNSKTNLKTSNRIKLLTKNIVYGTTAPRGRIYDRNGNVIYYQTEKDNETPLKHPDGTIIYVYAKVDSTGNIVNEFTDIDKSSLPLAG